VQCLPLFLSQFDIANAREILHRNDVSGFQTIYNLLAYLMIDVRFEPFFLAANAAKVPFCGSGSSLLQCCTQSLISHCNLFQLST
jgi:hypothetical protein